MFKNYHIVIFKDREGGFKNLRLRGWLGFLLFVLVAALIAGNIYLWEFYSRSKILEHQLEEAQKTLQENEGQFLSLSGKIATVEGNLRRIQQFDAKLRVLMNIGQGSEMPSADVSANSTAMGDPIPAGILLARHRELFIRRTHSFIDELSNQVVMEEINQPTLMHFLRDNKETMLATPSIWPANGFLSSGFGWRTSPYGGSRSLHKGLDIANRPGTPVIAPARGTVTFVGMDKSYGLCVLINHGNNISTRYAHLSSALVKEGQQVQRGDVVAAMGNTGRSTGPHLHYEVMLDGVPVDPMRYILN